MLRESVSQFLKKLKYKYFYLLRSHATPQYIAKGIENRYLNKEL
jgi:hypothetical protein